MGVFLAEISVPDEYKSFFVRQFFVKGRQICVVAQFSLRVFSVKCQKGPSIHSQLSHDHQRGKGVCFVTCYRGLGSPG